MKLIIVAASSGLGRELARIYADKGSKIGVTARRKDLLESLCGEYPDSIIEEAFDVTAPGAMVHLENLVARLGGLDLLIYCAGYGEPSVRLDREIDRETVGTNVNGFVEVVNFTFNFFAQQGHGHFAAISSVAGVRANPLAPAYGASKAFISHYLEALSIKAGKKPFVTGKRSIFITDIQPGFIATKMAKGNGQFWVAPVNKAAAQIYAAIEKKKKLVYITHRWWLIASLLKWMPSFIYDRIVTNKLS